MNHLIYSPKYLAKEIFSSAFVVFMNAILISSQKLYLNSIADLLLFAALLMEFAAQSSKGITKETSQPSEELYPLRLAKPQRLSLTHCKEHTAKST